MEGGGVDLVLARAIELRLKISNCIHKASTYTISNANANFVTSKQNQQEIGGLEEGLKGENGENPVSKSAVDGLLSEAEEEDEEAERLLHIRDALESLELQLSNFQVLQHQQSYEREVALSEIEHSRKILLGKLKEYKGEDLEVIQEACAFAGETVEHNSDLMLPPYPSRPPTSLVIDNCYLSHPPTRKSVWNGVITAEAKKNLNHPESNQANDMSKNSNRGLGYYIGATAKAMITLVGVISVLSLSGLGPKLGKRSLPFKTLDLFQEQATEEKRRMECPPGRVLVVENGEGRCIVKERVAIPFTSVGGKPDVNYGCG